MSSRRYHTGGGSSVPANMKFPSRSDKVTIYGRPSCPYTMNAVNMSRRMAPSTFYDITGKQDAVRAQLATKYPDVASHYTVPIVFVNDGGGIRFIGGSDSFEEYLIKNQK